MTRPMQPSTDERLDRLIRELLTERAEEVAAGALSAEAMVERIATRRRPAGFARGWVLLAAAAMLTALLIGGAIAVGGEVRLPSLLFPAPLASPAPDREIVSRAPSPAPDGEVVHGWPDTNENAAGLYSWDGSPCGMSCNIGFMHNGYGSGDVEIRIDVRPQGVIPHDGDAVTVAGHDGIYRRNDLRNEEWWIVGIEGTTIVIHLTARPGTSQADLEEAHAIIDSMRTEARDNDLGFRLIFTLTTDDWDSG
jgi:hypothetical protein